MLGNLYENIQIVKTNDIELLFDMYFKEVFPKIRQMIRERWKTGEMPNGNKIGIYSWYSYALFKQEINPLAGFRQVDLTLTGSLGQKITFGIMEVGEYEIFSTDNKYEGIIEKYGEYNFNISDSEKDEIANYITNKLINKIIEKAYYGKMF